MHSSRSIAITPDSKSGYRLSAEMAVELPLVQVFDLFSDAMQLERITPPWLHFSVLTPQPVEMKAGTLLDYRLYLHRIPINWRTVISVWEPPYRFVDQQLRGPYKRWYHEHTFSEVDGKTIAKDNVHYIPRGGRLLHKWLVRPDLEKIFRFRQDMLARIFQEIREGLVMTSAG
jgi:ligand-binding SRPBCC domain-containing protein